MDAYDARLRWEAEFIERWGPCPEDPEHIFGELTVPEHIVRRELTRYREERADRIEADAHPEWVDSWWMTPEDEEMS